MASVEDDRNEEEESAEDCPLGVEGEKEERLMVAGGEESGVGAETGERNGSHGKAEGR